MDLLSRGFFSFPIGLVLFRARIQNYVVLAAGDSVHYLKMFAVASKATAAISAVVRTRAPVLARNAPSVQGNYFAIIISLLY